MFDDQTLRTLATQSYARGWRLLRRRDVDGHPFLIGPSGSVLRADQLVLLLMGEQFVGHLDELARALCAEEMLGRTFDPPDPPAPMSPPPLLRAK